MAKGPSARRYAQAIFQIALDSNKLDKWAQDLNSIAECLTQREFITFLETTRIPLSVKEKVIDEVLSDADQIARNLLSLLVTVGAIRLIPEIAHQYRSLLDAHRGIARGEVVTAVEISPALNKEITNTLKAIMGKEVVVSNKVDRGILGGFTAKLGDRLIDGSSKTKLEELRRGLSSASA